METVLLGDTLKVYRFGQKGSNLPSLGGSTKPSVIIYMEEATFFRAFPLEDEEEFRTHVLPKTFAFEGVDGLWLNISISEPLSDSTMSLQNGSYYEQPLKEGVRLIEAGKLREKLDALSDAPEIRSHLLTQLHAAGLNV